MRGWGNLSMREVWGKDGDLQSSVQGPGSSKGITLADNEPVHFAENSKKNFLLLFFYPVCRL